MSPEQEQALFQRVARLEDFARRFCGLLTAAGKVLEMAPLVAQQAIPTSSGPVLAAVRRLYDFGDEPSEGAKHIDD